MKLLGRTVAWSEAGLERRQLAQITQGDIGISFEQKVAELTGILDIDTAAYFRGRQLTADTVASLPMQEYHGHTLVEPAAEILTQPDPQEIYHDTISGLVFDLIDSGDAFIWAKSFEQGRPRSVYVAPQEEVTVNWDRRRLYRVYAWRGEPMQIGENFWHIAINRKRGQLRGRGVLEAAVDNRLALHAQAEMARSIAEDNYTPQMLIKHPSVKTKTDADHARDMYLGDRASRGRNIPAVTSSETEIEQLTINPVDAQWIESRAFETQEAARYLGIPGWMLLVDSGSSMTYSNTEGVMRFWATTTLRPTYLERIEQTFSMMLPAGRHARFNLDEILRADLLARFQAYRLGVQSKFLTPNEARAAEGLAALSAGDDFPADIPMPQEVTNV